MHPPPPNHSVPKIYSMTAYCHSMHIKRDRVSLIVMQWFIINLGSIDYNKKKLHFSPASVHSYS